MPARFTADNPQAYRPALGFAATFFNAAQEEIDKEFWFSSKAAHAAERRSHTLLRAAHRQAPKLSSAHSPIGTIRPVSSATSMKSPG